MSKQATPHTHSLSRQSWKNILHSLSSYFWFLLFIYFIFFCTFFDWFSLYKCSKLFILSHRRLDTPDWICIFYYFQFPILFLLVTWKEKKSMSFVLLLSLSSHTHTHTRHNFDSLTAYYLMMLLSLQPLWMTLLAWQNLLTSRLWFRAQHTEIPITKTKTRLKKKLLPCLSFFIYRTNFHFSWFVYFFHYLMCRHEQNTQTKFPPPPTLHVSWKGREESNRDVCDSPLNATTLTCLVFVDNSKTRNWANARHDCLVPRFFLFIFLPLFFHTHTHKGMKKFSHYFCSTVFGSFVISLNIFKQQKRPKNSSEKKCTDKNTFTVHNNNNNITFQFSGCIF